jgi:hypothetical protein
MSNNNTNNAFTQEYLWQYATGQLTHAQMHELEWAAQSDPFLAESLEGYMVMAENGLSWEQVQMGNEPQGFTAKATTEIASHNSAEKKIISFWNIKNMGIAAGLALTLGIAGWLVWGNNKKSTTNDVAKNNNTTTNNATTATADSINKTDKIDVVQREIETAKEQLKVEFKKPEELAVLEPMGIESATNTYTFSDNSNVAMAPPAAPLKMEEKAADDKEQGTKQVTSSNANVDKKPQGEIAFERKDTDSVRIVGYAKADGMAKKKELYKANDSVDVALRGKASGVLVAPNATQGNPVLNGNTQNIHLGDRARNNNALLNNNYAQLNRTNFYLADNQFKLQVVDQDNNPIPFANLQLNNVLSYANSDGLFNTKFNDTTLQVNVGAFGFANSITALRPNQLNTIMLQPLRNNVAAPIVIANRSGLAENKKLRQQVTIDSMEATPTVAWEDYEKYIANNSVFKDAQYRSYKKGTVTLSFELDKKGQPKNIAIVQGVDDLLNQDAKRLLQNGPSFKKTKAKKGKYYISFLFN